MAKHFSEVKRELEQSDGHMAGIGQQLKLSEEARDARNAGRRLEDETGETDLADLLGEDDPELERQERGQWMEWILSRVTPQEKQLLLLRYEERLGQRETAKRMGVSQMQVSRMERRVLERLRTMEGAR